MANDAFMKPEVPDAFRDLMKVSIEQAKRAFDTFAATSETDVEDVRDELANGKQRPALSQ